MASSSSNNIDGANLANFVPCPVCERTYHELEIQQHVNKCIFLNTATSKRNSSQFEENATPPKKVKIEREVIVTKEKQLIPTKENESKNVPLAECMRPKSLEEVVGQMDSFGTGSMLHAMLAKKKIPNMILWGPPGCGKTSIANVVANICKQENNMRFIKMSAIMSGINDVKEVVKVAKNELKFKRQTVLFMDEIHRFNKLQQDTFLPHVENGTIILIGATTENPSFSLNNALLSRCRVVVLSKLSVEDIFKILQKAVVNYKLGEIVDCIKEKPDLIECNLKCIIERKSLEWLSEVCDGDARVALGALEMALSAIPTTANTDGPPIISLDDLKNGIKRTHMLYDRGGEEHYNIISAIHKSIRASDDNAALYWTTRALHGGEDPMFVARRLIRAACEDVGLGDPNALTEAVACLQGCQHVGMPECDVLLAQCAVRLARCKKNNEVYMAMKKVQRSLKEAKGPLPSVPLHLRNAPTKLMRDLKYFVVLCFKNPQTSLARYFCGKGVLNMDYGVGYNTLHRNISGLTYMPDGMENVNFFNSNYDN